jgi:hypothetical protein
MRLVTSPATINGISRRKWEKPSLGYKGLIAFLPIGAEMEQGYFKSGVLVFQGGVYVHIPRRGAPVKKTAESSNRVSASQGLYITIQNITIIQKRQRQYLDTKCLS